MTDRGMKRTKLPEGWPPSVDRVYCVTEGNSDPAASEQYIKIVSCETTAVQSEEDITWVQVSACPSVSLALMPPGSPGTAAPTQLEANAARMEFPRSSCRLGTAAENTSAL